MGLTDFNGRTEFPVYRLDIKDRSVIDHVKHSDFDSSSFVPVIFRRMFHK